MDTPKEAPPTTTAEEKAKAIERQEIIAAVVEELRRSFDARAPDDRKLRAQVALAASTEAHSNFRHWDVLKWAPTSWFVTIGVAAAVVDTDSRKVRIAAGILTVFGALTLFLVQKLTQYHKNCQGQLNTRLGNLLPGPIDRPARDALSLDPGFQIGGWKTATYWYTRLVGISTLWCLSVAFLGPWHATCCNGSAVTDLPKGPDGGHQTNEAETGGSTPKAASAATPATPIVSAGSSGTVDGDSQPILRETKGPTASMKRTAKPKQQQKSPSTPRP